MLNLKQIWILTYINYMYKQVYYKYIDLMNYYSCYQIKRYGYSVLGEPLQYIKLGNPNGKKILIQAGMHSREWCTIFVLDKFIKTHFLNNNTLKNEYYFILCSNPDGFKIATCGVEHLSKSRANFLLSINKSKDFSLWKANANAVDLNVNFNALWGQGVKNVRIPSTENYIGPYPLSEPETLSLVNLTKLIKPDLTISLHSKGEEIYYEFGQDEDNLKKDRILAQKIANATGYIAKEIKGSVGGYKDWCIKNLNIPSITIELGNDLLPHPINLEQIDTIFASFCNIFEVLETF